MYRFIRAATVKHPASVYIELFGEPVIHWHFKSDSADKIYELFGKLGQDRDYLALMDKYKDTWLEGSLKDRLVALMG